MEVLFAVCYVEVVIALLIVAVITRQCASVVRLFDNIVSVGILHRFVIAMVDGHWVLMVNIQISRVFVKEEATGAAGS